MAYTLAPSTCIRFELKFRHVFLHIWLQSWHGQNKHPVAVGRIGQPAADRLWQAEITVVRAHRPLRDDCFGLIVPGSTIVAADGDPVMMDAHRDILGLKPGHGGGQDQKPLRSMELHGNRLLGLGCHRLLLP